MNEQTPPKMAQPSTSEMTFVKKEFDEFKNKTTITHVGKLEYGPVGNKPITFEFRLRQVKTKDVEALVLDCWIQKRSDIPFDKYGATNGEIIFNCDQDNHDVKCHEWQTKHNTKTVGDRTYYYVSEQVYYGLTSPLLKQICDANTLRIQISGKNSKTTVEEDWCIEFQKYCRQFYNNAIDPSLYPEAVAGGPPKSGCFVATAAMGSYDDPAVQVLTQFRDAILLKSFIGRQCVHCYYAVSPGIATWMRDMKWMCRIVKRVLVLPASKIATLMLKHNRCDRGK